MSKNKTKYINYKDVEGQGVIWDESAKFNLRPVINVLDWKRAFCITSGPMAQHPPCWMTKNAAASKTKHLRRTGTEKSSLTA